MRKPKMPWVRMVCYIPVSLTLSAGALFGILIPSPWSFIFVPLCLWFCAYPYARWMSKHITRTCMWQEQEGYYDKQRGRGGRGPSRAEDAYEVPRWEEVGFDNLDEELFDMIEEQEGRGRS